MKPLYFIISFLFSLCFTIELASAYGSSTFRWDRSESAVTLYDDDLVVFAYQYAFKDHFPLVPATESRRFAGDYLYPFNGLDGENLVDNAPKDHYHHHGVFWTWPSVCVHEMDGSFKSFDLWTSNTNIRQRFVKFLTIEADEERAVISVENGWYIGPNATKPENVLNQSSKDENLAHFESLFGEKVMREIVTITTHRIDSFEGVPYRAIDIELKLTPTERPVSLQGAEKKSYGGLTIRFRPSGSIGKDRFITTDEGVASDDMPEKNLRWADFTSRFGSLNTETGEADELSGATIFLSPNFPDFPPTWLTRYYGPLCVGFPGVVAKRFEPSNDIIMRARIWIHKDLVSREILQRAFDVWAQSERERGE